MYIYLCFFALPIFYINGFIYTYHPIIMSGATSARCISLNFGADRDIQVYPFWQKNFHTEMPYDYVKCNRMWCIQCYMIYIRFVENPVKCWFENFIFLLKIPFAWDTWRRANMQSGNTANRYPLTPRQYSISFAFLQNCLERNAFTGQFTIWLSV